MIARLPSTLSIQINAPPAGLRRSPPRASIDLNISLPISKASTTPPFSIFTDLLYPSPMKAAAPKGITPPPTKGENCNDEHPIDIDAEVWGAHEASARKLTPAIPKVPSNIMSDGLKLPRWIQPSAISIGPYYYHIGKYWGAQKLKSRHAQKFIDDSEQRRDHLYVKIREKTPEFRKWYDHQAIEKFTDGQLATIFLLDGCFLLNFINNSSNEDGFTNLEVTNGDLYHIKKDLFLLENQLPYEVLKMLFHDAKPSNPSMEEKIKDFVTSHVPFPRGIWANKVLNPSPSHLLHYLHAILLDKPERINPPRKHDEDDERNGRGRTHRRSCRTVQELTEVGIHFKPSATSYLTDVSYKSHDLGTTACLNLPIISMNTFTMTIFLNLIAFESLNTIENLGVISYLCFMDSLIDNWDDVKELEAVGILRNFVGEQKDIAQFFNTVCSNLAPNLSAYEDVKLQIKSHVERHYNSRLRTWFVQCRQKYFSSPWSFIALIAAIIGLSLTAIQTYTSLFPQ